MDERNKVYMQTVEHIEKVRKLIGMIRQELFMRGRDHDDSKLKKEEFEIFVEYTPKLWGTTYGSDEYKQYLEEMKPALDHHYKHNSHHPEHFEKGMDDMNLVDVLEMFCDWKAATMRHADGDIYKSIQINAERFGISDQLAKILTNTVKVFEEYGI